MSTLESVIELDPDHPLALHLYIHAVEASPQPQRAMAAAGGLHGLVPKQKFYGDKHPNNGWGLWSLARSLRLQDWSEEAEAVDAKLAEVWADADIQLHSSCMCLPGV